MDQKQFKEYLADNGFISRKLLVTVGSILLVVTMSVLWAVYKWDTSILSTMNSSLVTLAIAFIGISAGRAALPAVASAIGQKKKSLKEIPNADDQ